MDPITLGLIGGTVLGAGKGYLDQGREKRQRAQAAETARWSPWTHMQPEQVQSADMLGSAMQGATAGGMMGSSAKSSGWDGLDLGGGEEAAMPDPGSSAGAMSVAPAGPGQYQGTNSYNQMMAQRFPFAQPAGGQSSWAGMR